MDVAIIGMAARFPEADNIHEFYKNLSDGRDSVRKFSLKRLKNTSIEANEDYQVFGFIEDIDLFDHKFFNISLGEAQNMDPHQRIMLEVAYETIENAGYNIDDLNGSDTSVFLADTEMNYYKHAEKYDPTLLTGNLSAALSGKISRFFNLQGASLMVDSACSSSLLAVHLAYNSLIQGESKMALTGGVKLTLFPHKLESEFGEIGIKSPDGKAKAFSDGANGTGGGEAVACILLKPLDKAIEDRDVIHAVLKGTAANQDANLSGSLTAPSSKAQSNVIKKAWQKAKIDPRTISYIEAHGTGTKLGDPIEVQGIDLAFKEFTEKKGFCALSSVKTNIGHAGHAAGISGLIKAILSLKYQTLFPSLNFTKPNPFIDFENSAVYINTKTNPWILDDQTNVRRAGVSSFGLSGTNCHAVLEEFVQIQAVEPKQSKPQIFTISAKDSWSVNANILAVSNWLISNNEGDLESISYTLNVGRKHYPLKWSTIADSKEELLEQLNSGQYISTNTAKKIDKIIFLFSDDIGVSRNLIDKLLEDEPVFKLNYESCKAALNSSVENENFQKFSFAFSFYKLLTTKGVETKNLIGDGLGQLVISVITGKSSLEDAIKTALKYVRTANNEVAQRCRVLLEKMPDENIVFAEMGPGGSISSTLLQLKDPSSNYEVIVLSEQAKYKYLHYLRKLYLLDCPINWKKFYGNQKIRKVELPSYQFNKTRCWLKEPMGEKVEDWLYEFKWVEDHHNPDLLVTDKVFLVFLDEVGLGEQLVEQIKIKNQCLKVKLSTVYNEIRDDFYEINATREEDYFKLSNVLKEKSIHIDGIIHCGSFQSIFSHKLSERIEASMRNGLFSQFFLTKAFKDYLSKKGFTLAFVTNNSCRVIEADSFLLPEKATSTALLKGILSEFPMLNVRGIDVSYNDNNLHLFEFVLKEIISEDIVKFTAYRKSKRYIQQLLKVSDTYQSSNTKLAFREGGVYIVTGGARGIGLEVSKSIAKRKKSHLIILGRTVLPKKETTDVAIEQTNQGASEILEGFKEIEQLGSSVEYYSVDVSDKEKMRLVFAEIKSKYKKIDGVIHSAGQGIQGKSITETHLADLNSILKPKVQGTIILEEFTKEMHPDFFVVFSSLNSVFPQKNSADYAAANAFEDAFALSMNTGKGNYIAINWPGWKEVGISFRKGVVREDHGITALKTSEGLGVFYKCLEINKSNIAVTKIPVKTLTSNPFFITENRNSEVVGVAKEASEPSFKSHEIEYKLLEIWYDTLKSESIRFDDDFFEIGGHSLNGTQVINRIKKTFGIDLSIDDLFDKPTINALSSYIREHSVSVNEKDEDQILPLDQKPYYSVSHAQKRYWILNQAERSRAAYNMFKLFPLTKEFDKGAFEGAIAKLVERHESLRTGFVFLEGELQQVIYPLETFNYSVQYNDLRGVENKVASINKCIENINSATFNLDQPPLFKISLIHISNEVQVFCLVIHHIITDGWSNDLLMDEFLKIYNSLKEGKGVTLNPLKVHYKDYAHWHKKIIDSDKTVTHKTYWKNVLSGTLPTLDLPVDYPRSVNQFVGGGYNFTIPKEISFALREFNKKHNNTMFISLLGLVNILLYKYTGQEDIVVGSPTAGRLTKELEDQVGLFLNNLPLRNRIDGTLTFIDFVKSVKENTLKAFQHQIYPYDKIVEDLNISTDATRNPLYDVLVVLNNYKNQKVNIADIFDELGSSDLLNNQHTSKLDLTFFFEESEEILVALEYRSDLYKKSTIEKMSSDLTLIADVVIRNPGMPLADLKGLLMADDKKDEQNRFEMVATEIVSDDF